MERFVGAREFAVQQSTIRVFPQFKPMLAQFAQLAKLAQLVQLAQLA